MVILGQKFSQTSEYFKLKLIGLYKEYPLAWELKSIFEPSKSSVLDAIPLCKVKGVGSSSGVGETEKGNGPLSHRKITPLNDTTRR